MAVGIDIGGTKIVAGLVEADGRVVRRLERVRTPESSKSGLTTLLVKAVAGLEVDGDAPIGVGVAGIVRWPDGEVEFAANHGHRGVKLARNLERETGRRVVVENDANAAAWSVAITSLDAGEGVLFVSVGTGLGSGFVVNGRVVRGQRGRGAELGHVVVDRSGGLHCTCGVVGCLEALASGWALERDGRAAVAADHGSPLARRAGREPVTTEFMISAALAGDADACDLVRDMGRHIGRAIGENVMSLLPVDRVVVGGGLAVLDELLIHPMRGACEMALARSTWLSAPRFVRSPHAHDAVLVGAARLAAASVSPAGSSVADHV